MHTYTHVFLCFKGRYRSSINDTSCTPRVSSQVEKRKAEWIMAATRAILPFLEATYQIKWLWGGFTVPPWGRTTFTHQAHLIGCPASTPCTID